MMLQLIFNLRCPTEKRLELKLKLLKYTSTYVTTSRGNHTYGRFCVLTGQLIYLPLHISRASYIKHLLLTYRAPTVLYF